MELVWMTGSFAQTGTQALRRAGSMAVGDLGARYEMSIVRTMTLGEEAMENWPKTNDKHGFLMQQKGPVRMFKENPRGQCLIDTHISLGPEVKLHSNSIIINQALLHLILLTTLC